MSELAAELFLLPLKPAEMLNVMNMADLMPGIFAK